MVRDRRYIVNTDSFHGKANHRCHDEYTVYTDGSLTQAGFGCGFVVYYKNQIVHTQQYRLNPEATVFQAKIEVIRLAANYLDTKYAYPDKNT